MLYFTGAFAFFFRRTCFCDIIFTLLQARESDAVATDSLDNFDFFIY